MLTGSKYKRLCIKALQNSMTETERRMLEQWKDRSPKHQAYFDKIKKTWDKIGSVNVNPPAVDIQKEWAAFEHKTIQATAKSPVTARIRFIDGIQSIVSVRRYLTPKPLYATIVIALIAALSIYLYLNRPVHETEQQTFTASNKQKVNVQLSDGSSIKLNSGTSLIVENEFDQKKREVKLNGEAYFDVAKEKRPCIILTGNARIEVLGTSFNVWSRNNITRVIVKEGVVRLSPLKEDGSYVFIEANGMSQVVANKDPGEVKKVNAERMIGWPEGKLVFEKSLLSEFINEIERQYNVDISISAENPDDLRLTGTFDNLTIDQVLSSICLTFNLDYDRIDSNHYVLKENKKNNHE